MNSIKKLLNKETVSYLFFGVMTTVVNYLTFFLCYNVCTIPTLLSNALAFAAAVIFAYCVNKLFVFESKKNGLLALAKEFLSFIGARLLTFALEQAGLTVTAVESREDWRGVTAKRRQL